MFYETDCSLRVNVVCAGPAGLNGGFIGRKQQFISFYARPEEIFNISTIKEQSSSLYGFQTVRLPCVSWKLFLQLTCLSPKNICEYRNLFLKETVF